MVARLQMLSMPNTMQVVHWLFTMLAGPVGPVHKTRGFAAAFIATTVREGNSIPGSTIRALPAYKLSWGRTSVATVLPSSHHPKHQEAQSVAVTVVSQQLYCLLFFALIYMFHTLTDPHHPLSQLAFILSASRFLALSLSLAWSVHASWTPASVYTVGLTTVSVNTVGFEGAAWSKDVLACFGTGLKEELSFEGTNFRFTNISEVSCTLEIDILSSSNSTFSKLSSVLMFSSRNNSSPMSSWGESMKKPIFFCNFYMSYVSTVTRTFSQRITCTCPIFQQFTVRIVEHRRALFWKQKNVNYVPSHRNTIWCTTCMANCTWVQFYLLSNISKYCIYPYLDIYQAKCLI